MTTTRHVLVIAGRTADAAALGQALVDQARRSAVRFTLLMPVGHGRGAVGDVDAAVGRLRGLGLDVEGLTGDADPVMAVYEAWDPRVYDEILISTLPQAMSRWLRIGLPARVERMTGAIVRQVGAGEPAHRELIPLRASVHTG